MTVKVDDILIIEEEAPSTCEDCGEVAELRPYGPGGQRICRACGNKDPQGTHSRMMAYLESLMDGNISRVVGPQGQVLNLSSGTKTIGEGGLS